MLCQLSCRYHKIKNFTRLLHGTVFVDKGMCADTVIHWKEGNPHAHILPTTRPFKENGDWGNKEKKVYKLDGYGEQATTRRKWYQKLEDAMRNYGSEYVLTDLSQTRKWRKCGETVKNHVNQYLQPENHI